MLGMGLGQDPPLQGSTGPPVKHAPMQKVYEELTFIHPLGIQVCIHKRNAIIIVGLDMSHVHRLNVIQRIRDMKPT